MHSSSSHKKAKKPKEEPSQRFIYIGSFSFLQTARTEPQKLPNLYKLTLRTC